MPQSYKVFIGGSVLLIGDEAANQTVFNTELTDPQPIEWQSIISDLETSEMSILIYGDMEENWRNFKLNFHLIEAAGGLVRNQNGEWLFIHRNGMWDLPKGKLETDERIEECAVREVAEECGIEEPTIVKPLSPTYHTYKLEDRRILKKTYWYLMKSSDTSGLIPQTEEGITEVKWVTTHQAKALVDTSFGSIQQVVAEGMS